MGVRKSTKWAMTTQTSATQIRRFQSPNVLSTNESSGIPSQVSETEGIVEMSPGVPWSV